jgi:uncharacterized protein (TIGR02246 family)
MSPFRVAALAIASVGIAFSLSGCSRVAVAESNQQQHPAITLGESWGKTLSTRDADKIASQYAPDAVLLATFNNKIDTLEGIRKYFVGLAKNPGLRVKYNTMNARVLAPDTVSLSGLYTFMYEDRRGRTVKVPARYTFVWEKRDGEWKIVEHHSSQRPEKK